MIEFWIRIGIGLAFISGGLALLGALTAFVELTGQPIAWAILITFVILLGAWFIGYCFRAGKVKP